MEIKVIGPEPPCIRCQTAYKRARKVAKKFEGVETSKLPVHSEEAQSYGKAAAGHSISEKEKVKENSDKIQALLAEIEELRKKDPEGDSKDIQERIEEIEQELMPVKEKAKEGGYLMTPVVIVNEKVKLSGEIPTEEQIAAWIKEEI